MKSLFINQAAGIRTFVFKCRKCGKPMMEVKLAGEHLESDLCDECEKTTLHLVK